MSPIGETATDQTDVDGWVIVWIHSPSIFEKIKKLFNYDNEYQPCQILTERSSPDDTIWPFGVVAIE